jgi:hypothetical protein
MVLPSESNALYIGRSTSRKHARTSRRLARIDSHTEDRAVSADLGPEHTAEPSERNCGMIEIQATLCHHLFQITVAERVPEIPPHAEYDDLIVEVASPEK